MAFSWTVESTITRSSSLAFSRSHQLRCRNRLRRQLLDASLSQPLAPAHQRDRITELTRIGDGNARKLQFILAVPARRYAELGETLEGLSYTDGLAKGRFAEHRLVVAYDPVRAAEQAAKRRERIGGIEELGEKLVAKLDAQDEGVTKSGRKASDRGTDSRFHQAIGDAELTRFIHADYAASRFSYAIDEAAIAADERLDGKLVLLANVPDFSAAKVVERDKSLADIERGLRVLKNDLLIAPVHHRLPERIRAHALICFLAMTMYRIMRIRLKAAGHAASPTTALEQLRRIQQHRTTFGD